MWIAVTAVFAAVMAGLAGVGVYAASQPPAPTHINQPVVNYGSQP